MNLRLLYLVQLILCFLSFSVHGQNEETVPKSTENVDSYFANGIAQPCISIGEYSAIEKQILENTKLLGINSTIQHRTASVSMNWPLRAATGFNDCSYYFIAAYVDQDTITGAIKDFNCGANTYDGHTGTDIAAWPFGFYKMDNSSVEVIAAAAGTIIAKADGNFDRNCTRNNLTANSIIIQHADGSYALYWHMKKNSVTTKTIGQSVVAGEYLGVVGSSGSASGPHLHFEVWTGNTQATHKDPYFGSCNSLNATSWWTSQKPYTETGVIKVSVNTTDIVLPGCPTTETTNESNVFIMPFQGTGLPAGAAKFYVYLRNEVPGLIAECKIVNPNGTTFNSWNYTSTSINKTNIRGFTKTLPTIAGIYTFQSTYNGITCSKNFEISTTTAVNSPEISQGISIGPSPSSGKIIIKMNRDINVHNAEICFYNLLGKKILQLPLFNSETEMNLNLKNGVYLYQLKNDSKFIFNGKIVIDN